MGEGSALITYGIRQLKRPGVDVQSGLWLLVYFACMFVLAYAGSSRFGGTNLIPAPWDQLLVAFLSLCFYYWGVASRKTLSPAEQEAIQADSNRRGFESQQQLM